MASQRIRQQSGFSMVELMVALVLGVILTGGVISVYISTKATYNTSSSLGEVEETGRYALGFMQPKVELAGSTGCSRPYNSQSTATTPYFPSVINSSYAGSSPTYAPVYDFGSAVYGYEATGTGINATIPSNGGQTSTTPPTPDTNPTDWSPTLTLNDPKTVLSNKLNQNIVGGVLKYNDILMVHEALATPVAVVGVGNDSTYIYVTPSSVTNVPYTVAQFNTYPPYAIATDCTGHGESFQVTSVNASAGTLGYTGGTPGNTWTPATSTLGISYNVQPAQTYVFYVGEGQDKWPALFEATLASTGTSLQTQELVSGVENMQVVYGVDKYNPGGTLTKPGDQIPDYFTTADQITTDGDWWRVVSVRVALVVQSDNYAVDKTSAASTNLYMLGSGSGYSDNTKLTTPSDQRLRRVFVQTFSIRSMLP